MSIQLPDDSKRQIIVGSTGSGKTTLAMAMLAHRSYNKMPWLLCNFKDDELINEVAECCGVELEGLKLPKKLPPGIYIARPDIDDWEGVESLLTEAWKRTHIGVYIDEGTPISIPKHPAYRRILTQGRSRRVPCITCTQRPVDLDRYAFSESEYYSVMELNDEREVLKIQEQTGRYLDMSALPKYHSYYLDRPGKKLSILGPAPKFNAIVETFERRAIKSRATRLI